MERLYFTKLILDGPLKGTMFNESISIDLSQANRWRKGAIHGRRGSRWQIVDASFQKYWRA